MDATRSAAQEGKTCWQRKGCRAGASNLCALESPEKGHNGQRPPLLSTGLVSRAVLTRLGSCPPRVESLGPEGATADHRPIPHSLSCRAAVTRDTQPGVDKPNPHHLSRRHSCRETARGAPRRGLSVRTPPSVPSQQRKDELPASDHLLQDPWVGTRKGVASTST